MGRAGPGHGTLSMVSESGAGKPGAGSGIELDARANCRHNPFNRLESAEQPEAGLKTMLASADSYRNDHHERSDPNRRSRSDSECKESPRCVSS
jgi:hypothetical protein